jgi:hypothetical protein
MEGEMDALNVVQAGNRWVLRRGETVIAEAASRAAAWLKARPLRRNPLVLAAMTARATPEWCVDRRLR